MDLSSLSQNLSFVDYRFAPVFLVFLWVFFLFNAYQRKVYLNYRFFIAIFWSLLFVLPFLWGFDLIGTNFHLFFKLEAGLLGLALFSVYAFVFNIEQRIEDAESRRLKVSTRLLYKLPLLGFLALYALVEMGQRVWLNAIFGVALLFLVVLVWNNKIFSRFRWCAVVATLMSLFAYWVVLIPQVDLYYLIIIKNILLLVGLMTLFFGLFRMEGRREI